MNIHDLTANQLKRGCRDQRAYGALEQRAARYPRCAGYFPSCAKEKPDHERFCEKEDCRGSEGAMGESATGQNGNSITHGCRQKEINEPGSQEKALR
jgi:hypothetical protein